MKKATNKKFRHIKTGNIVTAQKQGEKMYLEMYLRLQQEDENVEGFTLPDKKELIIQGLSWLEDNEDYATV